MGLRKVTSAGENRVLTTRLSPQAETTVRPEASALPVGFSAQQRGWGHVLAVASPPGPGSRPREPQFLPLQPWVGTLFANYNEVQGIDSTAAAVAKTFPSGLEQARPAPFCT